VSGLGTVWSKDIDSCGGGRTEVLGSARKVGVYGRSLYQETRRRDGDTSNRFTKS